MAKNDSKAKTPEAKKPDMKLFPARLEEAVAAGLAGEDVKSLLEKLSRDFDKPLEEVTTDFNAGLKVKLDEQAAKAAEEAEKSAKETQDKRDAAKKAEDLQREADEAALKADKAKRNAAAQAALAEGKVVVNVPKRFILTLDNGQKQTFEVGPQTMPRALAEHWYSKANGVKVVE